MFFTNTEQLQCEKMFINRRVKYGAIDMKLLMKNWKILIEKKAKKFNLKLMENIFFL